MPAKDAKRREREENPTLIYRDEAYRIVGACFEVYKEKGCGFLEPVYQECLSLEFRLQEIPVVAQRSVSLEYKGHPLGHTYTPDFVCFNEIIVEIKAVSALADEHRAQVINDLHATGMELGLLVNFGHYPKLEWERLVVTTGRRQSSLPSTPMDPCTN
jgi:GxxExxY protein